MTVSTSASGALSQAGLTRLRRDLGRERTVASSIDSKSQFVYPFWGKAPLKGDSYLNNPFKVQIQNSTDLEIELGRRPELKSNEFFEGTLLKILEIIALCA